jgi:hypothetical protein
MREPDQRALPPIRRNASPGLIAVCIVSSVVLTVSSLVTLIPGYLPGAFLVGLGFILVVGNPRLTPGARSANLFTLTLLLLLDLLLIFALGI